MPSPDHPGCAPSPPIRIGHPLPKEIAMPRIIVTADPAQLPRDVPVLLDEEVRAVHLSTGHAAAQLLQRIAWAVGDADGPERAGPRHRA